MTVLLTTNKVRAQGNGSTTVFSFTFKVQNSSDLEVYKVVRATDVATLQILAVDYTVTLNTGTDGGTVTYAVAPTSLQDSFIKRVMDQTQETDIPNNNIFREVQVENALDKQIMIAQQIQEEVDRCLKLPITSSLDELDLPTPEAGKVLGWNDDEDGFENFDNAQDALDGAEAAASAAAASAAAAALSVTAAAAQVTLAIAQVALATTQATNAAASAAAAAISAAAAAASAASLTLPTITGNALKLLQVKADETGYQFLDNTAVGFLIAMASKIFKEAAGADVASANSMTLGEDGNTFLITGTTQINTIVAKQAGTMVRLIFQGALTLSTSGNLKLNKNTNYTTVANDTITFVFHGSNWWELGRAGKLPTGAIPTLTPNKSEFLARLTGTGTPLTWDETGGFDSNSNFTANTFTCSIAGKYFMSVSITLDEANDTTAKYIALLTIRKNGAAAHIVQIQLEETDRSGTIVGNIAANVLMDLVVSDTVDVLLTLASWDSPTTSDITKSWWSGFLIPNSVN